MKRWHRFILVFLVLILSLEISQAKEYSPELSGKFEVGDRTYTDIFEVEYDDEELEDVEEIIDSELGEEILDQYYYKKFWLRYKQKLSSSDYYYIKGQYHSKEYQEKDHYNNVALDLWTNYTFRINEQLRNKVMLDLRNKDYYNKVEDTYNQIRLKYQIDYKINDENDCTIDLQRRWKNYDDNEGKDNRYDKIKFTWDWDVSADLTVSSGVQFDWTKFKPISESTNKENRKFDIGFKLKL